LDGDVFSRWETRKIFIMRKKLQPVLITFLVNTIQKNDELYRYPYRHTLSTTSVGCYNALHLLSRFEDSMVSCTGPNHDDVHTVIVHCSYI
jgi:hypothetical protein